MIELMITCEWDKQQRRDAVHWNPAWVDIEVALRELHNQNTNYVFLYPVAAERDTYLSVCGSAGKYILDSSVDDYHLPVIPYRPYNKCEIASIVIGGQECELPFDWIVDIEKVREVVEGFYQLGNAYTINN